MSNSFVFKSEQAEAEFKVAYDETLSLFPVGFETSFVATEFGETHVITCGDENAPPLILLHGMNVSSTMWYPNIASLSNNHRVHAVDIISDSNKSVPSKRISKKIEYMKWLDEALDNLEIGETSFVGHSFGGWMSLNYALHAPQRVKKLAMSAPGWFVSMSLKFVLKASMYAMFCSRSRISKFISWTAVDDSKIEKKFVEQFYFSFKNTRFDKVRIMPTVPKDDELKNLSVPTMLLVGEHEVIYNGQKAVDRAKRLIPNIKAELVPQSSHCLTMEKADEVNRLLVDFLSA
jgi:pimeloyl-ACP methyl ester carboxylesterase